MTKHQKHNTFEGAPVILRRTNRKKTIALSVRDGNIAVLAPQRVSYKEIDDLIASKTSWLRRQLAKHAEIKRLTERRFVDGETFLFLGEYYPLNIIDGSQASAKLVNGRFVVHVQRNYAPKRRERSIRAAFLCWYKSVAGSYIEQRVRHQAAAMALSPTRISYHGYKSIWGKCTSEGELAFNWKLVMGPLEIIDYVVVHELAHLCHPNHSREFWETVETAMPDYRPRRKWLKEHGRTLTI